MSRIGPKHSSYELLVRRLVKSLGQKFDLHEKSLPGSPDLVFPKQKKVIFIHGCFWHAHTGCKKAKLPGTNKNFWRQKVEGNMLRDRRVYRQLNRKGWKYLCIWQCRINKTKINALKKRIERFLAD